MPLNVSMYQPRIPISGGGGVIDLSAKENQSQRLIAQALGQLVGGVARGKPQQEQVRGIVVRGENSILLINPKDGSLIKDLGPPPKGEKANAALDAIVAMGKISNAAEDIPTDALPQPVIDEAMGRQRTSLMGELGLEEYEVPGEKRSRFGMDWLAKDVPPSTGVRRIGQQPDVGRRQVESKEIPPKPKEYPDAKWNEEHQMWTIIKKGRLMGVK